MTQSPQERKFSKAVTLSEALNDAAGEWAATNAATNSDVLTGIAIWLLAYCCSAAQGEPAKAKEILDAVLRAAQELLPLVAHGGGVESGGDHGAVDLGGDAGNDAAGSRSN